MGKWTNSEIEILKSLDGLKLTKNEILLKIKNKSYDSIAKKARKLKIKFKIKIVRPNTWAEEENKILLENYKNPNIIRLLNRTKSGISQQLNKLGVIQRKPWAKGEDAYLVANYKDGEKEILIKKLNKSWDAIKLRAQKLHLNRGLDFARNSDMEVFLDNSNQSFYWLGFLLADGHFDFKSKRIVLTLSDLDYNHLKEYGKFLNTTNMTHNFERNISKISIQNIDVFDEIIKKLYLTSSNKTETPNDFYKFDFTKEQILSLIIGFIDGDGCIKFQTGRSDCSLAIHLHNTWIRNLEYIEEFLYDYFEIEKEEIHSKIGNDGYARLIITNNYILKLLKKEVCRLNLIVLNRKWGKINENRLSKKEIFENNVEEVRKLYLSGVNLKEIRKNYTRRTVIKAIDA